MTATKDHRGVIANIPMADQSNANSTDTDNMPPRGFKLPSERENQRYYMKFSNDTDTTLTPFEENTSDGVETPSELYKLKTNGLRTTPSRIEFRLYKKSRLERRPRGRKLPRAVRPQKSCSSQKRLIDKDNDLEAATETKPPPTLLARLQNSLRRMKNKNGRQPTPLVAATTNDISSSNSSARSPRGSDRIDVYYFDHGSAEYFRTTDCPPTILSELLARQTTQYATRFWAEIFGSLHIGVAFFVAFFLQTYRFLLFSVVRTVLVGFLQMTADYFMKPLITVVFNGFLQPIVILVYNLLSSLRDMFEPIAAIFESFLKPIANLLRAFRLVVINNKQTAIKQPASV